LKLPKEIYVDVLKESIGKSAVYELEVRGLKPTKVEEKPYGLRMHYKIKGEHEYRLIITVLKEVPSAWGVIE